MAISIDALVAKAAEIEKRSTWTLTDAMKNPELAWNIIDILIKEDAVITEVVGKVNENTFRTNISTVKAMKTARKNVKNFAGHDYSDAYGEFYKDLLNTLDAYGCQVLMDMYQEDEEIIQKAEAIDKRKRQERSDILKAARAAKK